MLHEIKTFRKTYRLFRTSTSQLKEMSFWFLHFQDRQIEEAWTILGDFQSIKNVPNYVTRIADFIFQHLIKQIFHLHLLILKNSQKI